MRSAALLAGLLALQWVLLTGPVGAQAPADSPSMSQAFGNMGDVLSATRNRDFLATPLTNDRVDGIRSHVGRDVSDRVLGSGTLDGHSVKDMISSHPEVASDSPQILSYLAARERRSGVRLYRNDRDVQPLDVKEPGRVIPTTDLARLTSSSAIGERMAEYLQSNFGMDEAHVKAFRAFLDATGPSGGNSDPAAITDQVFWPLRDVNSRSRGGLYVPSPEVLTRIANLLAFLQEYRKDPGADANRFRGPDGRYLADFLGELEPDPAKRPSPDDLRRMSQDTVRQHIASMIKQVSQNDINGPNKFLFDMGLAWVNPNGNREQASRPVPGRRRRIIPNPKVREENDKLYKRLILDELKASERDAVELDSMGEVFAIRGKPSDLHQKHYDPPLDPDNLYFGSAMTLQARPNANPGP
jgi:hypothetical protein